MQPPAASPNGGITSATSDAQDSLPPLRAQAQLHISVNSSATSPSTAPPASSIEDSKSSPDIPPRSSNESPADTMTEAVTFDFPPGEPPSLAASTTCKFWAEGYCFRGPLCWYRHGNDTASASASSPDGTTAQTTKENQKHTSTLAPSNSTSLRAQAVAFHPSSTSFEMSQVAEATAEIGLRDVTPTPALEQDSKAPEQPACLICFEVPAAYGLLDSCSHPYCLSCIRQWRKCREVADDVNLSGVSKRCPICRGSCRFIIPSSEFHPSGPAKDAVVLKYKDTLASKPCCFFEATKTSSRGPFCKFGDDCHYAHFLTEGDDRYFFGGGFEEMATRTRRRRQVELLRQARNGTLRYEDLTDDDFEWWRGIQPRLVPVRLRTGNDPNDWDNQPVPASRRTRMRRPSLQRSQSADGSMLNPDRFSWLREHIRRSSWRLVPETFLNENGRIDPALLGLLREMNRVHAEDAGASPQTTTPSGHNGPNDPPLTSLPEESRSLQALPGTADEDIISRNALPDLGVQISGQQTQRAGDGTVAPPAEIHTSSGRSQRRTAQRRYLRQARRAGGYASGSTDPRPTSVTRSVGHQQEDVDSSRESFELVGEEEAEHEDAPSPSDFLFNLARAFDEGYERGDRWEEDFDDEHNEHSHADGFLGEDVPDEQEEEAYSDEEDYFQFRVGPGGSVWLNGEEIVMGRSRPGLWDDSDDE